MWIMRFFSNNYDEQFKLLLYLEIKIKTRHMTTLTALYIRSLIKLSDWPNITIIQKLVCKHLPSIFIQLDCRIYF